MTRDRGRRPAAISTANRNIVTLAVLLSCASAWAAATSGCGSSSPAAGAPAPRHAGLVDAEVIRNLSSEGAELSSEVMGRAREEAVLRAATAVDDLDASEVAGLRLDISIAEVDERPSAVRVRCLVTVSTVGPPERTRAILQGAATVHRGPDDVVAVATAGAVRAALRRLPQALSVL